MSTLKWLWNLLSTRIEDLDDDLEDERDEIAEFQKDSGNELCESIAREIEDKEENSEEEANDPGSETTRGTDSAIELSSEDSASETGDEDMFKAGDLAKELAKKKHFPVT